MYCRIPENWEDPVSSSRGGWMHSYSGRQPSDNTPQHGTNPLAEGPIRTELVARVRNEIALGFYDTSEKMDLALEKLFKQVFDY